MAFCRYYLGGDPQRGDSYCGSIFVSSSIASYCPEHEANPQVSPQEYKEKELYQDLRRDLLSLQSILSDASDKLSFVSSELNELIKNLNS